MTVAQGLLNINHKLIKLLAVYTSVEFRACMCDCKCVFVTRLLHFI